jgi:TP901 family phage tail tape measure protein
MRIPTEFTAVDKFTSVVKQMTAGVSNFSNTAQSSIDRLNTKLSKVRNNMAIGGAAIMAPLGVALNSAIKFEDKMADVAKTTGLTSEESDKYGKSILDLSKKTRTSIDQLQDIGVVAGTIGVAKDELEAFTKAGNEFAIALGSDFGSTEEAVTQVAKLKNLFKETRDIDIATSMTKAGSAINEVSNMAGSSDNINDFMLRIGALPDSMKPTIQQSAALGGFLEDAGLSAEIAAGGFSNLILTAGKNLPAFADQMGMTVKETKKLYAADPTEFALRFSKSLNKMSPDQLAKKLAFLKIGSQESIKVVGALGSGYEKLNKVILTSNDAFAKGTSISDEAAKKNETMAGKLAIAKNNIEALSITVGTELAPVLDEIIPKVVDFVQKIGGFIKENPNLITDIAIIGGVMWGLSFAIDSVKVAMTLGRAIIGGYTALMAAYEAVALTAALGGYTFAGAIWAALWPVLVVIAVIAAIIAIIYYWDEIVAWFGKQWEKFTTWIGELWDSLVKWFEEFDFKSFFVGIGQLIIDWMLMPIKGILKLVSMIPGAVGEAAQKGLDKLNELTDLSMQLGIDNPKIESPEEVQSSNMQRNTVNGNIDINLRDKGGFMEGYQNNVNGFIPVNVSSTQGAF